ncbi:DUF2591 domain-containing protein [Morganella morganii]|uniref:phage protein NinX family protein n=1 Tax=Morganella morganii TaxID=582 RepID=UPI0022485805|nr:phage protein NinX family protein [Morganella morganii]MCW9734300.1 DUF2591 domain-containing protein [Morganella morganii]
MNKYRDKSDFEINKAVADFYLTREYRFNSADKIVELMDIDLSCEFGGEINLKDKYVTGTFDPCNNPADAMPIIMDNKIDLTHIVGNMVCAKHKEYWCIRKNPYRAGCEVYLLMKDAENEK